MIHKRSDGLFFRCVAVLLFLSACAWCGAGLFARLRPSLRPVSAAAETPVRHLRGLCLRCEAPLSLPASAALALEAGERVPAGGLIARRADGGEIRAGRSALFFPDTDGWESLALPAEALDAPTLRALLEAPPETAGKGRGRLVYDSAWYYAALLTKGAPLPEPGPCRLRFEGTSAWVPARLLQAVGTEEESFLLFRLTQGGTYLSLRRCGADLYDPQEKEG